MKIAGRPDRVGHDVQRLAEAEAVGRRDRVLRSLVREALLAGEDLRMIDTYSRVRASGRVKRWPYQPSTTCGPLTRCRGRSGRRSGGPWSPRPSPWPTACGPRLMRFVPRRSFDVPAPHQARGVSASLAPRLGGPHGVVTERLDHLQRLGGRRRASSGPSSRCASRASGLRSSRHPSPSTGSCTPVIHVASDDRRKGDGRCDVGRLADAGYEVSLLHELHRLVARDALVGHEVRGDSGRVPRR